MCVKIDRTKGLKEERIAWCVVTKTDKPRVFDSAYLVGKGYRLKREYAAKVMQYANVGIGVAGFHVFPSLAACAAFFRESYTGPSQSLIDDWKPKPDAMICRCKVRGPVGVGVIPETYQGAGRRVMKYKYRTLLEVVE